MKCRIVTNNDGEDFQLTEDEEKYIRALERLEKMNPGRLDLFGEGHLSVRIDGIWNKDEIMLMRIQCSGGDGGD